MYYVEIFEVFKSLREDEVFCDIKLETDEVVLSSASQYFHTMFTNFAEKNQNIVIVRQLELLVNFIYSGEIIVTKKNLQVRFEDNLKDLLNSVENYHPILDKWSQVAEMCVPRSDVGVGVLDGVLNAVSGCIGYTLLRSAEAYRLSTGVWTTIADIYLCQKYSGVVALNGLLYIVDGSHKTINDCVEFHNPNTNTWIMGTESVNVRQSLAGVVTIDNSQYFLAS